MKTELNYHPPQISIRALDSQSLTTNLMGLTYGQIEGRVEMKIRGQDTPRRSGRSIPICLLLASSGVVPNVLSNTEFKLIYSVE